MGRILHAMVVTIASQHATNIPQAKNQPSSISDLIDKRKYHRRDLPRWPASTLPPATRTSSTDSASKVGNSNTSALPSTRFQPSYIPIKAVNYERH